MMWNKIAGVIVATALVVGCQQEQSQAQNVSTLNQPTSVQVSATRQTAITRAVTRVSPSVITVQTQAVEHVQSSDVFQWFFGGGQPAERSMAGLGSGFIVRSDGVIVTNAHVVNGATQIFVALRDGTRYTAKVMGVDAQNDLAVLKIDAKGLPVAPLGSSDNLLLGEWSIAIGNPYGFVLANTEPSVTVGVVSGVGRNLVAPAEQTTAYVDMIQTDAAINPGNSGGPLVDADGEVIGVNSSIYSPSGGSVGIGFAIPINRVRRVVEDLITHGSIRQAWTGVKPAVFDPTDFTVKPPKGVVVASVAPGSPAERAGLERGDIIVQAGTRTLHNAYDWEAEMLEERVGERIPLVVRRGSRELNLTVRTTDLPEVNAPRVTVLREIQLITLTPAIRVERGLKSTSGAYVQSVSQRVSDAIGLQTGDVIVQINRTRIGSAEDAARALNGGRGPVVMYVERQGQYYSTEFETH